MARVTVDLRGLARLRTEFADGNVIAAITSTRLRQELAAEALRQHQQRFGRREAPDGTPWPRRRAPTGSHPLLEETGELRRSIRATPIDDGVAVRAERPVGGVDVAAVHQYGSERIPQRQFLGFGTDDVDDLTLTADQWLDRWAGELLR